ncbi:MAG: metallophosphoesterase family protein [Rhodocyclaceae bacterium]|nr:metallophosphoesterase family protein [Rhodocyclaceae bacterium]
MRRIGLVSDTHGLLRPAVLAWLAGSDHIIHAGDIGDPDILAALLGIAPVTAVRGNNDHGPWAEALAEHVWLAVGGVNIHVLHDLAERADGALDAPAQVVVCGHSHKPAVDAFDDVLVVNPGSAGPRRFRLPIAAGALWLDGGAPRAVIQQFDPD